MLNAGRRLTASALYKHDHGKSFVLIYLLCLCTIVVEVAVEVLNIFQPVLVQIGIPAINQQGYVTTILTHGYNKT